MTRASSLWRQGELSGTSTYYSQNGLFARLLHFPSDDQLVQDRIGFLEVEDEVELADLCISAPLIRGHSPSQDMPLFIGDRLKSHHRVIPTVQRLTLPKYRSSTSTYRCIVSNVISSLSPGEMAQMKKSEA